MRKVAELWDRIASLLYPKHCVLCDAVVEYDVIWCGCKVERVPLHRMQADALNGLLSPFVYENVQQAILQMKRDPDCRAFDFYAGEMAELLQHYWSDVVFDHVLAVPMQPRSLRERGFNQAALLAEALCRITKLPFGPQILARRADSEAQHTLSAEERLRNAQYSYQLLPNAEISGIVLLVDDVFTTGATLQACANLLRTAGVEQVYGITAAHTAGNRDI